jgi:hypothetical protein
MGWITLGVFFLASLISGILMAEYAKQDVPMPTLLVFSPYLLVAVPLFLWWRREKMRRAREYAPIARMRDKE